VKREGERGAGNEKKRKSKKRVFFFSFFFFSLLLSRREKVFPRFSPKRKIEISRPKKEESKREGAQAKREQRQPQPAAGSNTKREFLAGK
jgi:hypothetical protein